MPIPSELVSFIYPYLENLDQSGLELDFSRYGSITAILTILLVVCTVYAITTLFMSCHLPLDDLLLSLEPLLAPVLSAMSYVQMAGPAVAGLVDESTIMLLSSALDLMR